MAALTACGEDNDKVSCTEGATLSCAQADGRQGQSVCQGGSWTACSPLPSQCDDGTFRPCETPAGKPGTEKCEGDRWGRCEPKNPPPCQDGDKQACSTKCGTGTEVCLAGVWQNCDAPKPEQEVCDGYDNNCDGDIDEVCMCIHGKCEPCYTGPAGTRALGTCKPGQRCCNKGQWTKCENQVLPAAKEDCTDTLDNDCNDAVNDGCVCLLGESQPCGSNVGECEQGTQYCEVVDGEPVWGPCLGGQAAQDELSFGCDGKDQNCNNINDDGLPQDAFEINDTCPQARHVTIEDDGTSHVFDGTIYPNGDIDYMKVSLQEVTVHIAPNACECSAPFGWICDPSPQCLKLDLQLVSPAGTALEATVLDGSCQSPWTSLTTNGSMTVQFDGTCGKFDSRDLWIRVAAQAGATSAASWSCEHYKLVLKHYKVNNTTCADAP